MLCSHHVALLLSDGHLQVRWQFRKQQNLREQFLKMEILHTLCHAPLQAIHYWVKANNLCQVKTVRFWQHKKKMITEAKSYQKIPYQNGVYVTRVKSLPYNNFKTLKILFRFPRAKVNSNKIFKPSGWIKPSSLEQNKRKEIQLHDKDVSLMAHIKFSKDKKNWVKKTVLLIFCKVQILSWNFVYESTALQIVKGSVCTI